VAYELQLPFALKELRDHAGDGVAKARETYDAKSGQMDWLQHVKRHIFKAVAQGGIEEEAKAEGRLAPEGERVREALETFREAREWKHLLKGCTYEEAEALGSYLDAHRGELEKSLGSQGKKMVGLIEAAARKRRLCLALSNPEARWISVTDPLWAELLRQCARARSLEAVRNSELVDDRVPEAFQNIAEEIGAKGFTELKAYLEQEALHELLGVLEEEKSELPGWAEMASDRNVAKILNKSLRKSPDDLVTPYLVRKWHRCNKHTPPSEFDGSFSDYLYYIRDPSAYKRLLEHHRRSGEHGAV
jgi:hypothetical protein